MTGLTARRILALCCWAVACAGLRVVAQEAPAPKLASRVVPETDVSLGVFLRTQRAAAPLNDQALLKALKELPFRPRFLDVALPLPDPAPSVLLLPDGVGETCEPGLGEYVRTQVETGASVIGMGSGALALRALGLVDFSCDRYPVLEGSVGAYLVDASHREIRSDFRRLPVGRNVLFLQSEGREDTLISLKSNRWVKVALLRKRGKGAVVAAGVDLSRSPGLFRDLIAHCAVSGRPIPPPPIPRKLPLRVAAFLCVQTGWLQKLLESRIESVTFFFPPVDVAEEQLRDFDVLFFSGGDWPLSKFKGDSLQAIRGAVRGGAGFFGVCAGQVFAAQVFYDMLGKWKWYKTYSVALFDYDAEHPVLRDVAAAMPGLPLRLPWWGAPILDLGPIQPEPSVLLWHHGEAREAASAMIETRYGKGRMLLCGPHPDPHMGKKFKWPWVPCMKPLPNIPPEPNAIFD